MQTSMKRLSNIRIACMKNSSDMRGVSGKVMSSYFLLFVVAQVLVGFLVATTIHDRAGITADLSWRPKSYLQSSPLLGELLNTEAARELQFVQEERSWMSMVYHDETSPALRPPQKIFNSSIPLAEFCEGQSQAQYAIFRNVMLIGRQLLLPSSIDCSRVNSSFALSTPYHRGQNSTPELQAWVVPNTESFEDFESEYSCHERVYEPSVLFSFINWPQHGHALFNTISLLWEAFQHQETGPLFKAGKNVRLYAYGDSMSKDYRQEWQQYLPFFDLEGLQSLVNMFSHQPVRSLASLLMQSDRHPICFTYLLAGVPGELDHYNFEVPLDRWRGFARAVREHFGFGLHDTPRLSYGRPLERVVPSADTWLYNKLNISGLGEIRPVDWGKLQDRPRLLIIDRRENRLIMNVKELHQIAKSTSYFRSVEIVYLEDLKLEKQIRLVGETDVLFGMDGTGLMNGMFMPEGGIVVHVRPYGCAEFLPAKGTNLDRLWSAHPGRVLRYESGDKNTTRFPRNIKERPELVFNHNSTVAYRFPFILRQDTNIDPDAFRCILDSSNKLLHNVYVDWELHNWCTKSVFV